MEYKVEKLSVTDLPRSEQQVLEQLYGGQMAENRGYSPNHIIYVRQLTPVEAGLFEQQKSFQPVGAFVQNLYKLRGRLLPTNFNRALHMMVNECEALRTNYCSMGNRIMAVVLQERRHIASVVYRNLEGVAGEDLDATLRRIMDADLRQGFDVRHDSLVRFSIFHTTQDEYAILVTAVQALLTNFDVRQLFARALGTSWQANKTVSEAALAQFPTIAAPVRAYWTKMLGNFPQNCRIPQSGKTSIAVPQHRTYLTHVPAPILSDIRSRAKDNKRMLMSILQTAWGILLLLENKCRDVGYCLRVPRRERGEDLLNCLPSLVPIRLQVQSEDLTVQELVNKIFQQFVISQPYAALGRADINKIMGQQKENFDHFLDFCDFFGETQSFSTTAGSAGGQLVLQNFWDGRDSKLGISFRQEENQLIMSLQYDERAFTQDNIEVLVKDYLQVLQQILTDWNLSFESFMERLHARLQGDKTANTEKLENRAILQNYLFRLNLFQELDKGFIQRFMEYAKLDVLFEGDRIADQDMSDKLVFLASGRVSRSMEMGDGWYYTLDIQKEGSWLNELVLLPDRQGNQAIEVLTEQAVILTIPLTAIQTIMETTPLLSQSIIRYVIRQMEKYQRLWIQS